MKICLECRKKMGDALKQCPYCQGEAVREGDPRLEAPEETLVPEEQAEPESEDSEEMTPEQKKAALMASMMKSDLPPEKKPKLLGCLLYLLFSMFMGVGAKIFYDWLYLGRVPWQ